MVTATDAFPSKYLKAADLDDTHAVATIKLAELEQVKGFDGKPQSKVIVYFAKKYKPLILNRVNFDSISDIADSGETDDWGGTRIELYTTPVTFNGKTTDGIRIRKPNANAAKPRKTAAPVIKAKPEYDDEIPFSGSESGDE